MPKLSSAVPKYRKHKPSGQAVVTLGGRDHYLGPHSSKSSIALYDRLVAEYLATGRRTTAQEAINEEITVAELIAAFWKHAQKYYRKNGKPTSELHIIKMAVKVLKEFYGREAAADFGPLKLKACREAMIGKAYSRTTVNSLVSRIKNVFRWGVAEQLVPATLITALDAVKNLQPGRTTAKESEGVKPVPVEVVDQTVRHLSPIVGAMVRFQLATGCRPAEVCQIRPMDIDRTGPIWEYRPPDHKLVHKNKTRVIFIGPAGQEIIGPYIDRDPSKYCFSPKESAAAVRELRMSKRVTPLRHGNRAGTNRKAKPQRHPGDRFTSCSYARAITRACEVAFPPPKELKGDALKKWIKANRWSPNQLRHTAATAIRQQFGLEAASIMLGHSSLTTTLIYAEANAAKARQVAEVMG
jgi:integrase